MTRLVPALGLAALAVGAAYWVSRPDPAVGGIAPMALDTVEASFMNLVGVVSVEVPPRLRVEPFQPEESYLIWKLDGRDGIVGDQMPLFGTPLTQAEIDVVAQWIADGAEP